MNMDSPCGSEMPAGYEETRRAEVEKLHQRMTRSKLQLTPVILGVGAYLAYSDHSLWRRILIAAFCSCWVGVGAWEWRGRVQHGRLSSLLLTWLPQAVIIMASGGIYSPFLPMSVNVATLIVPLFHGERLTKPAVMVAITSVWILVALQLFGPDIVPTGFSLGRPSWSTSYLLVYATVMTLFSIATYRTGNIMRAVSCNMLRHSLEARDEALSAHSDRLRDLTTLSGEMAHELKNPLASVKGLAALMACEPDRAQERLKVMRQEIDRMQGILDEFLNFSRPLSPLMRQKINLREVITDVVDLHEGLVRQKQLELTAVGTEPVEASCDPQKVKQILINLVQNALDVSPPGSEILLTADQVGDEVILGVLDRGTGLPVDLAERILEPGVTTKANGSGLGLTVVRLLAEQHGGIVRLGNRDGGGCHAEVLLPSGGAPVRAQLAPMPGAVAA